MRAAAQILFRRRRLILGVFLLAQIAGGLAAALVEPRWRAEAVLPASGEVQVELSRYPGLVVEPDGGVLRLGLDGTDADSVKAAVAAAVAAVRPRAADARQAELESQLAAARSDADAAADRLALLKARLASIPATIAVQSQSGRSRAAEDARAKLFELQAKEQELLGKYQPDSTFVRRVRDEQTKVRALAEQMETAPDTQITQGTNPVHQEVEKDLIRTEASLSGAKARIRSLTRQVEAVAPRKETAIAVRAVTPSHTVIAVSSGAAGLMLGIGLAVLAHLLSTRLSTPADVERRLGLPVLTTIPRES